MRRGRPQVWGAPQHRGVVATARVRRILHEEHARDGHRPRPSDGGKAGEVRTAVIPHRHPVMGSVDQELAAPPFDVRTDQWSLFFTIRSIRMLKATKRITWNGMLDRDRRVLRVGSGASAILRAASSIGSTLSQLSVLAGFGLTQE